MAKRTLDPANSEPTASQIEYAAEMAHEANRNYCESIGDTSIRPWGETPENPNDEPNILLPEEKCSELLISFDLGNANRTLKISANTAFTPTNVTTDHSYDANSTTVSWTAPPMQAPISTITSTKRR